MKAVLYAALLMVAAATVLPAGAAKEAGRESAISADDKKVFRYSFRVAESGFDPAQISDIYSRSVTPHIFEALYQYDPLARPAKVRPLTADGMPQHSADYRTWTVKIKPGIYFASDPAFKGQRRELVAEDYVYSFKRFADPAVKSPAWTWMDTTFKFVGLAELRQQALDGKKPFDYGKPIDGIRALDRYTVQFKTSEPSPRFITGALAGSDLTGAVAREVAEHYGDAIMGHPVGTGPFKLTQWRRSSFIALERNPEYREVLYDAEPAAGDVEAQAILKRLKGKRLPMIDRVEISIIEESQPRWLTFLKKDIDLIDEVPAEFITQAMPGGKVAPNLVKQGVQGWRMVRSDVSQTFFNMDDPVVGGYTPDKVALRRAIFLAVDVQREINLVRHGQAIVAQSPVQPNTLAYDPKFKSENGEYSLPKARALLDMFGYVDKDGDGWRDMPDGAPLVLKKATQPDQQSRQLDEQWRRDMKLLGVRIEFQPAKWPENLKAARAGKLMMWGVGSLAASPDGQGAFQKYHSKQIGGQNQARFKNARMDAIYDQLSVLPDGPERMALFEEAKRLAVVYAPYKTHVHRMVNDMAHPWVVGYRRPLFWQDYWQYIDIDGPSRAAH
ncbi:MAG TPA: ABC transporter substrate-binding protein [Rubrivivax sp.]|nr:ABC transporter substrate-binding protein [Rubrivivax sp.]